MTTAGPYGPDPASRPGPYGPDPASRPGPPAQPGSGWPATPAGPAATPAGPAGPAGAAAVPPAGTAVAAPPGTAVPPPQGPGVRPPFAAPPTDRDHRRMWIMIGVGALVLVLCAAGGVFGVGALLVGSASQLRAEARSTVSGYLSALRDRDFTGAYDYWCDSLHQRQTVDQFVAEMSGQPQITGFTLRQTEIGSQLIQPVTVSYSGIPAQDVRYILVQQGSTGALKICQQTQ